MRACVHACVCVCVRVCVRACVRACAGLRVGSTRARRWPSASPKNRLLGARYYPLAVPLFMLWEPLFPLPVPFFPVSVPLFPLSGPLFAASVPFFPASVPLFPVSVLFFHPIMRLFLAAWARLPREALLRCKATARAPRRCLWREWCVSIVPANMSGSYRGRTRTDAVAFVIACCMLYSPLQQATYICVRSAEQERLVPRPHAHRRFCMRYSPLHALQPVATAGATTTARGLSVTAECAAINSARGRRRCAAKWTARGEPSPSRVQKCGTG